MSWAHKLCLKNVTVKICKKKYTILPKFTLMVLKDPLLSMW